MPSEAGRKDPSMLGKSRYARSPLDFYPSPRRTTEAFLKAFGDDLEGMIVWEPCCGNGAISKVIEPFCRGQVNTDIRAYEGFDPDALFDFFSIQPAGTVNEDGNPAVTLDDLEALGLQRPDAIITNPPYGKQAERFVRHALKLLEPENGFLAVLCRHEWDTAKTRADIFDHPAFAAKVTMRFRPVWIEKVEGDESKSPRFSYSWFCWDFVKARQASGLRPEIIYVA